MTKPRLTRPRVFVLLVFDPTTGAATRPVGALALADDRLVTSFVPYADGADTWRARLADVTPPPAETVRYWLARANGITSAIAEVESPNDDPRTAVELVVDVLLALNVTTPSGAGTREPDGG